MRLRAKSRAWQWGIWSISALVAFAAYVLLARVVFGCAAADFMGDEQQRVLIPILVAFGVFAYETRWSGVAQEDEACAADAVVETVSADEKGGNDVPFCSKEHGGRETSQESLPQQTSAEISVPTTDARVGQETVPIIINWEEPPSGTGEAEFTLARQIPHQVVPDYSQETDGKYLDLLGRSAACGYPLALAKLGEYAVRREAWIEAYYWTWRAVHAGLDELNPVLKSIRLSWATEGYPDEEENVHRLFSPDDGSAGRALLDIDSGREVILAKEYLKRYRPELLSCN